MFTREQDFTNGNGHSVVGSEWVLRVRSEFRGSGSHVIFGLAVSVVKVQTKRQVFESFDLFDEFIAGKHKEIQ
jgi:hypothetical protein